jgi:hypothetical protein
MLDRRTFAGAIALAPLAGSACAQTAERRPDRAEMYLVDWNIEFRTPLSIDQMRRRFHAKYLLRGEHYVAGLLDRLGIDCRLVVDLYRDNERTATYFCDAFRMYSADGSLAKPINAEFKDRFQLF